MKRPRRREDGAALVELAFIIPIVALLVLGTIDIARAYRLNIRLEGAAREGAAFLQIYPNDVTCSGVDVRDRVAREDPDLPTDAGYDVTVHHRNGSGGFDEYDLSDDLCQSEGSTPVVSSGDRVRVDVSATFDVLTPMISYLVGDSIGLTGSAEVVAQG